MRENYEQQIEEVKKNSKFSLVQFLQDKRSKCIDTNTQTDSALPKTDQEIQTINFIEIK